MRDLVVNIGDYWQHTINRDVWVVIGLREGPGYPCECIDPGDLKCLPGYRETWIINDNWVKVISKSNNFISLYDKLNG